MRPTLVQLILSAALLTSFMAMATPGVDEPPEPGPALALVLPHIQEATLPNGLRLIVAERHDLPLATVALHLKLGSANDPQGQAGLASMTAELRSKGATHKGRTLSASALASEAEALGAALGTGSSWDGTTASMTVATSKLQAATALVADTMRHPTLAGSELDRLREQTIDGLKLSLSDPMALAGMAARRSFWGASVFGASVTPASVARIKLSDVKAFHQQQCRPDLATLVFTGDVSLEQAKALALRVVGDWTAPASPAPQAQAQAPSPQTPETVLVNLAGSGQSGVIVMAPSVPANSPERRVAQVAAAVLGGGYSARLNTEVRIKRGLSYGASASNELESTGGFLRAGTQTNHPTAAQVVSLIQGEIVRMGQANPTPDELSARQATLIGNFGRQIETTAGLATTVLNQVERGRPLSDLQKLAPDVLAVTAEQVKDFAARHWQADQLRTVVVGDLAAAGDVLKTQHPKALVLDATQLDLASPGLKR